MTVLTWSETYSAFSLRLQLSALIPLRSSSNTAKLISLCSVYLLCCNLIVTDQSVCTLSWAPSIWACDCIVAKWIWNWYWSPGLPKSRRYSFNKKVENTAKGELKVSRGGVCQLSVFALLTFFSMQRKIWLWSLMISAKKTDTQLFLPHRRTMHWLISIPWRSELDLYLTQGVNGKPILDTYNFFHCQYGISPFGNTTATLDGCIMLLGLSID